MKNQILVVDDEPNVRLSYRVTLETEGYNVWEADSGSRALELLAANEFDLAVLDMRMPEMDGLELLAAMRQQGLNTPTVIITAYGDIPHAVRAMKLGAIDFLKKPLTPEQLRRIAGEVLDRHEGPQTSVLPEEPRATLSVEDWQRRYLKTAKRYLNLRDFFSARIDLARATALDPSSPEAFNLAGVLDEMEENYDGAKKHYGRAIELDSRYEPAQQNMRRIFELFNFGSSRQPLSLGSEQ